MKINIKYFEMGNLYITPQKSFHDLEDCPHWLACVHSLNGTMLMVTVQMLQSHAPNSLEDLLWLVYGEDGQCDDSNRLQTSIGWCRTEDHFASPLLQDYNWDQI